MREKLHEVERHIWEDYSGEIEGRNEDIMLYSQKTKWIFLKTQKGLRPGIAVHTCNLSNEQLKTGRLHVEASLDYPESLKKKIAANIIQANNKRMHKWIY